MNSFENVIPMVLNYLWNLSFMQTFAPGFRMDFQSEFHSVSVSNNFPPNAFISSWPELKTWGTYLNERLFESQHPQENSFFKLAEVGES